MEKELTYKEAYTELQDIVREIENDEVDLDVLQTKLKRASELIGFCREKLLKIEVDTEELISEIENQ